MKIVLLFVFVLVGILRCQNASAFGIPDPIHCHKGTANQWVTIGSILCYCKELVVSQWPIVIKKYFLEKCQFIETPTTRTTTTQLTTTQPTTVHTTTETEKPTTTPRPNKCPSVHGSGLINFSQGHQANFFKKQDISPQWEVQPGGYSVVQATSDGYANPSSYIGREEFEGVNLNGAFWPIGDDNDFFGVVFGFQNSYNFYLFSWKFQNEKSAEQGFTLQLIQSLDAVNPTSDDLKNVLFHRRNTTGQATTILKDFVPYENKEIYQFSLIHRPSTGLIQMGVFDSKRRMVVNTRNLYDTTFQGGRIGAYSLGKAAGFSGFHYLCTNGAASGEVGP